MLTLMLVVVVVVITTGGRSNAIGSREETTAKERCKHRRRLIKSLQPQASTVVSFDL